MKRKTGLLLALVWAGSCLAQDLIVRPDFGAAPILDGLAALTGTRSQTSAAALELLELVALGRTSAIRAAVETEVGLAPGTLGYPKFAQAFARVRAIQEIGECGLPGALDFLKNLKRADLGDDETQTIWPNSRMTLRKALLSRIASPQARTEFLMTTLAEEGDGRGLTAHWAIDLLCDQGSSAALPLIRRLLRSSWSGQRAEDAIAFCETRMQIVSRDLDRAKALGTVLTVSSTMSDEILRWAIYQLDSIHSEGADAELDRFAKELGTLREGSPEYGRFSELKEEFCLIRGKLVK